MEYRILEQWTDSSKLKYKPQVRVGKFPFRYWSDFECPKFIQACRDLGVYPPFGMNIAAICDSYTEAKDIIDRYKIQNEPVKQNIMLA